MIVSSPAMPSCLFGTYLLVIVNNRELQINANVPCGCLIALKSVPIDSKVGSPATFVMGKVIEWRCLFPPITLSRMDLSHMILLPNTVNLSIERVVVEDTLSVTLRSELFTAVCPSCGQAAKRIHSRDLRHPDDLPISGRSVRLVIEVRRFFCDNACCPRKTFAEQLPTFVRPHAQRTVRLQVTLQQLGLADGEGKREPSSASTWDCEPALIACCASCVKQSSRIRNQPRSVVLMIGRTSVACAMGR